jgi:hypothetical protein
MSREQQLKAFYRMARIYTEGCFHVVFRDVW